MSVRTQALIGMVLVGIVGCGKMTGPPVAQSASPETADVVHEVKVEGGGAQFGSQCPLGSYSNPQPVPIVLWSCPIGLSSITLNEPLQPIVLQMDCKKKTIDVRGEAHSGRATTWEVMPDGSFYFTVDGGKATLKSDGAGNSNCTVPLTTDMWGKVDCKGRDHVTIRLETVWWLGKSPHDTTASNSTSRPTGSSSTPISLPSPSPASADAPLPFEVGPPPSSAHPPANLCKLPKGCYFHTITKVQQCS